MLEPSCLGGVSCSIGTRLKEEGSNHDWFGGDAHTSAGLLLCLFTSNHCAPHLRAGICKARQKGMVPKHRGRFAGSVAARSKSGCVPAATIDVGLAGTAKVPRCAHGVVPFAPKLRTPRWPPPPPSWNGLLIAPCSVFRKSLAGATSSIALYFAPFHTDRRQRTVSSGFVPIL